MSKCPYMDTPSSIRVEENVLSVEEKPTSSQEARDTTSALTVVIEGEKYLPACSEEPYVSRQTYVEGRGEVYCGKPSKRCLKGGNKFPGKKKCLGCPYARYIARRNGDTGK